MATNGCLNVSSTSDKMTSSEKVISLPLDKSKWKEEQDETGKEEGKNEEKS